MGMPTIIAINIAPEKLARMRMLCLRIKARLRPVERAEFGQKLAAIVGLDAPDESAVAPDEAFDEEVLVLSELSGAQLNLFLQDFKRFGISPVALKAVLTATNAQWTPAQLHSELCAEREAFANGMQAHSAKPAD